ncbi:MAG TPA: Ig-like domain-containing protein, partial [Candidatus Saccharimonadales bacterium]|nr:Ig-like domain-containing protein [Candidatus Saccharimonadales bacterium]
MRRTKSCQSPKAWPLNPEAPLVKKSRALLLATTARNFHRRLPEAVRAATAWLLIVCMMLTGIPMDLLAAAPVVASALSGMLAALPMPTPAPASPKRLTKPAEVPPPLNVNTHRLPRMRILPLQSVASGPLRVSVGFADSSTQSANFPEPWNESNPAIKFIGGGAVYRAGAIRLDNPTSTDIVADTVKVDLGRPGPVFQLWSNVTVPAFGSAILTQTADGNFNTSGSPIAGCGVALAANETRIPKITVTVGGAATDFADTAHVLDTGGFDSSCRGNQSLGWRPIGTTGMEVPGASVQLVSDHAPHAVGTQDAVSIQVADAGGQPLAGTPVSLQVVNGPNTGKSFGGVTDSSGGAAIQYSSATQGQDLLQAVIGNPSGGSLRSQQVSTLWTSADACSAPATPGAAATRMIYVGQNTTTFGDLLRLAVLLTDGAGVPLANRTISFSSASQTFTATTDSNGLASQTASLEAGQTAFTVNFAGDQSFQAVQLSTSVTVLRAPTLLRYTGPTLVSSSGALTATAVLTDAQGRTAIAGRTLSFSLGGSTASAVTDVNGMATAAFNFTAAQTPGAAQMQIVFAGDADYQPSTRTAAVQVFGATPFVIWGGNDGGLKIGQRVNFWGEQWASQVTGGQYGANPSFKGFAETVDTAGIQQCQPGA